MSAEQLRLFDIEDEAPANFAGRNRLTTTFKGKLIEPVHRWFRLTPSFSPQLVRDIFDKYEVNKTVRVLDPYCGTGTVPLEAQRRGNQAVAVEINPGLHFTAQVKTACYLPELVEADLGQFLFLWKQALEGIGEPAFYLTTHPELIPGIAYPERWWATGTLAQLSVARFILSETQLYHYPDLVRFTVGSIVIEVSAAKHNHPSMSFAEGAAIEKDAVIAFQRKCVQIIDDIRIERSIHSQASIYRGNTKELTKVLSGEAPFDLVVTSPPYPNRFSYARETRPLLFFLDLVENATQVGTIETEALGGTWGRATWNLQKEILPANPFLEKLLKPFTDGIKNANPILKHYIIRYFNDLWEHARQIDRVTSPKAQMAWVVGNTMMVENEVATAEHLVAIFRELGWQQTEIIQMRKRHSKRGLYESIVFLSRN